MEEGDGSAMSLITEPAQLEALMESLNRRGLRERALFNALKRRQHVLLEDLQSQPPRLTVDVASIDRHVPLEYLLHLQAPTACFR